MDRVQFLHSISCPEVNGQLDIIISFFEQYMLLYNVIDDVSSASLIHSDNSMITFQITCTKKESAESIYNSLRDNPSISIYESVYLVHADIIDDHTINITISN